MTARLTAEFWVAAYRRRLELFNIPVFVVARGDATAGAILIKLSTLDGQATLYQRSFNADGQRLWMDIQSGTENELDAYISKQRDFDPDLWVLEIEDRAGRHMLDEEGLE